MYGAFAVVYGGVACVPSLPLYVAGFIVVHLDVVVVVHSRFLFVIQECQDAARQLLHMYVSLGSGPPVVLHVFSVSKHKCLMMVLPSTLWMWMCAEDTNVDLLS